MKKLPFMLNLSNYLLGKHKGTLIDLFGYNENLVDSVNDLSLRVLRGQLTEYSENNLIFSPISIILIVSILNYGLGDLNTKARLDLLGNLNLNSHRHNLHTLTGDLLKNLTTSNSSQIDILTVLQFADYLGTSWAVEDELSSNYKSLVTRYDFSKDKERNRALNETYRLIRTHTKNQLNLGLQYLPRESSRLNIYSTMNLNVNWLDPFNSLHTFTDKFYNQNGKLTNILYMSRHTYVKTSTISNRDLQLAELSLGIDNELSLILIHTTQPYSLPEMLFNTKIDELNSAIKNLTRKYINIVIPRFTVEHQFTIQELLKPLKVDEAFDCKKNSLQRFSGKKNRTCLDFNLLYTKLRVDEQGLNSLNRETGFFGQQAIQTSLPKFFVQSPFVLIIRHRRTGVFLLVGLINHF